MRIVSFLPSATEALYELGAASQIAAVTHECSYPPAARRKPVAIRASFDPGKMTAKEIDAKIVELARSGGDIYRVDGDVLKKARPDLIVAQGICEVCSPFTKEIARAVSLLGEGKGRSGSKPDVFVLDPHDLDGVLASIMDLAVRIGKTKEGEKLVASLQKRIDAVRAKGTERGGSKPRVLCLEWFDPLFTAGHWVPQMVEIAGGVNGISSSGEPSRRMGMDEALAFDPDIIVLMPCGFDVKRTEREMRPLAKDTQWKSLRAVKEGRVYAVDANSYFSKPGPRIVTGVEILAKIIRRPEAAKGIRAPRGSYKKIC